MEHGPIYRVRIVYTEPAFQARLDSAPEFYSIDYLIRDAESPEEAVGAAMREWDHCSATSRVGWGRFLESITVHRQTGPSPDGWEISCAAPAPRKSGSPWRGEADRRVPRDWRE